VADKTVCNEQFTQFVCGAVEHRTIGEGLVHLQMALSAMSLVDDVKAVKHVEDNAPRLLLLQIFLGDPSRPSASCSTNSLT
jgi:hypothetical protein